jgi:hypothetical protein
MADKDGSKELTEEEVEKANGEPLPDREAMSIIRGGFDPVPVVPIEGDPTTVPLDDPHPNGA